ncbi:MAG: universal stress protein UspA related nucleotide-binding protein, partial [halophilic archaeon J07HB67]
ADIEGRIGDPGAAVANVAADLAADRVVVGGRDRSPTGKAGFGSTAQNVLLSAPCPVTFVRRDR